MAQLVILRLEGLLQSWGEDAKWDTRPTAKMPTKSAVVGLLSCAMGLERDDAQISVLADSLAIGIRADRSGTLLEDFHTVQGMPYLMNAEGRKRSGNTIVTPRQYLQDASFMVALETTADWQARICSALQTPHWPIYLGRKSCVPSRPVLEGTTDAYTSVMDAIRNYPRAVRADAVIQYEVEAEVDAAASYTRPDRLIGARGFTKRRVWHGVLEE